MYASRTLSARTLHRSLWVAMLLIASLGLPWLVLHSDVNAPPATQIAQLVSTAVPSHRTLHATVTVAGAWIAREEVAIGSPLDGLRVAEVLVESGEPVKRGQVLVRLERAVLDSQARQTEHAAKRARAELAQATEQHLRAQRLLPAGAVSRQDYEAARATMQSAQAALQQAQAAWDEQRVRQAHTEIRAPVAGTITQRAVQVGAMVGAQTTLFRLSSDLPPEFLAQIPQQVLPELVVGMPVQVSTSGREAVLAGKVRLISSGVDAATGYGQVRVTMDTAPPPTARPGIVGNARIVLAQRDALALDVRALRYDSGSGADQTRKHAAPYVFVVDAGRARHTPVQIGMRENGWVEIRAGVDANSRVVVAGATLLQDGDAVQAQDVATAKALSVRRILQTSRLFKSWLLPWKSLMTVATASAEA